MNHILVLDALAALAAHGLPELKRIYTDLVPTDFLRPSLLIEIVTCSSKRINTALRHIELYFTLTVFDVTDDYDHSDTQRLVELQQRTLELFENGILTAGDRALPVTASTGGRDWDKAFIDVQLSFYDRIAPAEELPLIESVETKITAS